MNIIIGHSNMDLDCVGSMVLAGYLYPDYVVIKSRLAHPVARNVLNLYKNSLNFNSPRILKGEYINSVVIVDTRTTNRVNEYFEFAEYTINDVENVTIFDHHTADCCDIHGADLHSEALGSNVAIMVRKLIEKGITIDPTHATIALTGLYADTGSFEFETTTSHDFSAAGWLISQGAQVKIVRKLLKPLKEEAQIDIFHIIMNKLEVKKILGNYVLLSFIELEKQQSGINAVVEKIMDIESPDAFFLIVSIKKGSQTLIIGRSQIERINVNTLLKTYGGGGHSMASSAKIKEVKDPSFIDDFVWHLRCSMIPSISAGSLMTHEVYTINEDATLLDASMYLEQIHHTGCPVVNRDEELVGVITLRDISKGRMAEQMQSPVKSYMAKKIETFNIDSTVREIENTFFSKNIGHIPVVTNKKVVGIVTRQDFLDHINGSNIA
ncbi:MAG: CBS domain-containing protein [Spirochaetales bacterium]|nr:CBS domain-containing protein [Spirochaetales bacterium]